MRIAIAFVAALLTAVSAQVPSAPAPIVIHRHFAASAARYLYVPFEVSPGTEAVTIGYRYSGDDGSSVVDLGLFEPGPTTLGAEGFRGYSGGAQRTITVGRRHASPGYRTGPLPPGTWHVMLGMYRIAPAGVDVDIEITEAKEDSGTAPAPGRAEARAPASRAKAAWYSGGLHLHTTHSDGSVAPAALAEAARAAGLDFVAITDHNNTIHSREPMPGLPLHIIGEEVTTPGGHASVWGLPEGAWIDFRISPTDARADVAINDLVTQAHRAGALFAINHPFLECGACAWDHVIPEALDAIEVWNGAKGPQPAAIAVWDRLLRQGRRVTAVGASDWHRAPAAIGAAAVRVFAAELTVPAILEGIRQHRVIVMRDALTPAPVVRVRCGAQEAGIGDALTCGTGDDLSVHVSMPDIADAQADFVWNAVQLTSKNIGGGTTFTMAAGNGFLRVHVRAADGSTIAITNPVYVEIR